jgi:hypothetical protein
MSIFEPLLLLLAVVALVMLGSAARSMVAGKRDRAVGVLKRLGIGAGIYFTIVVAVSLLSARRVYHLGDTQCFDDWCITVLSAHRSETAPASPLEVSIRLSNRAKRVPMGETGTVVYLTDAQGRRYDPLPDPAEVRLDTKLQPGESVIATRRFDVPKNAQGLGLVYTHEGGFPIQWFVISEGGWFQQPPIVSLN